MAEVLGVVAGGVGVAAFALQVAESIVKVKRLYSDLKSAPADIKDLLEEIDSLGDLLSEINDSHIQASALGSAVTSIWEKCHKRCIAVLSKLNITVVKLEKGIRAKRPFGTLKAVLRKSAVSELKFDLERAKTTLMLAQQAYLRNMQKEQLFHLLRYGDIHLEQLSQTRAIQTMLETSVTFAASSQSCPETPIDRLENENKSSVTKESSATTKDTAIVATQHAAAYWRTTRYQFRTPTAWMGKVWSFDIYRTFGLLQISIRSYNVVPWDSAVFRYVQVGNLDGLQRLLGSKEASIFDTNSRGWSLLHYAVIFREPSVIEWLLFQGADASARDDNGQSALNYFSWKYVRETDVEHSNQGQAMRLLLTHQERMGAVSEKELEHLILDTYDHSAETLQIISQHIYPSLQAYDMDDRVRLASRLMHPALFWMILGQDRLDETFFEADTVELPHLMYGIVTHLAICYVRTKASRNASGHLLYPSRAWHIPKNWIDGRRQILLEAVRVQAHLTTVNSMRRSPLVYFMTASFINGVCGDTCIASVARTALRTWITELATAGADLAEYGRCEYNLFCSHPFTIPTYRERYERMHFLRIIKFTYGPAVEDWDIWISWPLDEWAGEFWHMVENPELSMPGSWIETYE